MIAITRYLEVKEMNRKLFGDFAKRTTLVLMALLLSIGGVSQQTNYLSHAETIEKPKQEILNFDEVGVHDPSIIKAEDTYYVFGTHGAAAKSKDLKNWQAFENTNVNQHPLLGNIKENFKEVFEWAGNSQSTVMDQLGIWAPDVYYNASYKNEDGSLGAYLMYVSVSTGKDDGVNEHYRSLIALASSKNIEGPYVYQDTVIYSGFRNNEDDKGHYDNTDFNQIFKEASPRSGYFYSNGSFNFELFPNAIDPTIIEGHDGKIYMSYGSWNGGIWVLELDKESGLPKRQADYNGGKAEHGGDTYFGQKISGGYKTSGEGSYIQYHEESGYYHLYVTYGGLVQNDSYNVRFFRSKNIAGPYVDMAGNNPDFTSRTDNSQYGNRLVGSFDFLGNQSIHENAKGYNYRVPGHNSVLYDEDGKAFIAFHTRFKDSGEAHELRIHQLLFNEEGWPMIAPQRYHGETVISDEIDLSGSMLLVNQGKDNLKSSKTSMPLSFEKDGKVLGEKTGTWKFESGILSLTLDGNIYEGYVLMQSTSLTNWYPNLTFTLLGKSDAVKGHSILGVRTSDMSIKEVFELAKKNLSLSRTEHISNDIDLPLQIAGGVEVSWSSDNEAAITKEGVIHKTDVIQKATLSAHLKFGDESAVKTFDVTIATLENDDFIEYQFESSLKESQGKEKDATLTGNHSTVDGGHENYDEGIVVGEDGELGTAFYFDGNTGVKLPNNLVKGNEYSISFWLNAEETTMFTPGFFAMAGNDNWLSILPSSWDSNIMVWSGTRWYDGITNIKTVHNDWYHYTLSVSHGEVSLFLNGMPVHVGSGFPDIFSNDFDSEFSLGVNPFDIPFKGWIDDLRIYPNDSLSGSEVKAYYDNNMLQLSPEKIAEASFNSFTIPDQVTEDIVLPLVGKMGSTVTWESSNDNWLNALGEVTRPLAGQEDVSVTLTATLRVDDVSFTKSYEIIVKAEAKPLDYLHYAFENTLDEQTNQDLKAQTTQDKLHLPGGNELYRKGIKGNAFYFDGSSGVRLPNDMIIGNSYTISMWVNPESLSNNTPAFFGAKNLDQWLSILPAGHDGNMMVWSGTQWYDAITNLSSHTDRFYHFALTVDNGKINFYIDGETVFSGSNFPNVFTGNEIAEFALGVNYWDAPFKGMIDELVVYPSRALDEDAIVEYYESIVNALSPEEIASSIFAQINLPEETTSNIELIKNIDNVAIEWSSSNTQVISNTGVVTQPKEGSKDIRVRLNATVIIDGQSFTKEYIVNVLAKNTSLKRYEFNFESTLNEAHNEALKGSAIGSKIGEIGGKVGYKPGILGESLYLSGNSGVQLPNNLITSNKYSVSLWLNPEELTDFTTAFFGAQSSSKWLSVVPKSGHEAHKGNGLLWSGEEWYDGLFTKSLTANSWNHVVFTVDSGKINLYLDGNLVHSGSNFPDVFSKGKDNIFTLGVNYWDIPFKGSIDELIIFPDSVWGSSDILTYRNEVLSQLSSEQQAEQFFNSLSFGEEGVISTDIKLPSNTSQNYKVSWKSTNEQYLSSNGKVTRPSAKVGNQNVILSATIVIDGVSFSHQYHLVVKAESAIVDRVHYAFEKDLNESSKEKALLGQVTGKFVNQSGSSVDYKEGKVGSALYLNGSNGVRLPDNLITGNKYSVSMWLKPEALTDFTTAFFGSKDADHWISFTPKGVAQQAVLWSGTTWYDGLTNRVMNPNMWTHVAFTVDQGNVKVYMDGELSHTGKNFPNIFDNTSDNVFSLGVNYWDIPFKGHIDELIIETKKVMSADEIYNYYDSTVGADRFVRNIDKHLKLDFDQNIGPASLTGDKLDVSGGKVRYEEGVINEAVYLDGRTGVRLPNNFLTSNRYSLQMWVNPESITPFSSLFFGGTSHANWVNLPASGIDGKTMFWAGENWYDAITKKTIPSNLWSHLAVTVDKGHVKVFIDGEVEFEGQNFPDVFNSKNSFMALGVNYWDPAFKGLMDEFEIYNNAVLSNSKIKEYYEETKPLQEEFERNQEKTHIFKFEDNLMDSQNETLEGSVVGEFIHDVDNGSVSYVEGQDGKAIYLDGTSGILLPKELITSENYSVSLWVNPEVLSTHTTTFFGAQNESSWLSVVMESGEFTKGNSMVWSGTNWYDGNLGTQVPVDTWSHIAFTVSDQTLSAYLNGEKVFTGDNFPDIFQQKDSVFSLGVNYWDTPFQGLMDEVMVFDSKVLTDDDILSISKGEFDVDQENEKVPEETIEVEENIVPYVVGGTIGVSLLAYFVYYIFKKKK